VKVRDINIIFKPYVAINTSTWKYSTIYHKNYTSYRCNFCNRFVGYKQLKTDSYLVKSEIINSQPCPYCNR